MSTCFSTRLCGHKSPVSILLLLTGAALLAFTGVSFLPQAPNESSRFFVIQQGSPKSSSLRRLQTSTTTTAPIHLPSACCASVVNGFVAYPGCLGGLQCYDGRVGQALECQVVGGIQMLYDESIGNCNWPDQLVGGCVSSCPAADQGDEEPTVAPVPEATPTTAPVTPSPTTPAPILAPVPEPTPTAAPVTPEVPAPTLLPMEGSPTTAPIHLPSACCASVVNGFVAYPGCLGGLQCYDGRVGQALECQVVGGIQMLYDESIGNCNWPDQLVGGCVSSCPAADQGDEEPTVAPVPEATPTTAPVTPSPTTPAPILAPVPEPTPTAAPVTPEVPAPTLLPMEESPTTAPIHLPSACCASVVNGFVAYPGCLGGLQCYDGRVGQALECQVVGGIQMLYDESIGNCNWPDQLVGGCVSSCPAADQGDEEPTVAPVPEATPTTAPVTPSPTTPAPILAPVPEPTPTAAPVTPEVPAPTLLPMEGSPTTAPIHLPSACCASVVNGFVAYPGCLGGLQCYDGRVGQALECQVVGGIQMLYDESIGNCNWPDQLVGGCVSSCPAADQGDEEPTVAPLPEATPPTAPVTPSPTTPAPILAPVPEPTPTAAPVTPEVPAPTLLPMEESPTTAPIHLPSACCASVVNGFVAYPGCLGGLQCYDGLVGQALECQVVGGIQMLYDESIGNCNWPDQLVGGCVSSCPGGEAVPQFTPVAAPQAAPEAPVSSVAPRLPIWSGTAFVWANIIQQTTPSVFSRVDYAGIDSRFVFDRRVDDWVRDNFYIVPIHFQDGRQIEANVNLEFGSVEEAQSQASFYGKIFGQFPKALRDSVTALTIHRGDNLLGASQDGRILIHTDYAENNYRSGYLEEILVHECAHTLSGSFFNPNLPQSWYDAVTADAGNYISEYASLFPDREDFAETFHVWMAIRYFPNVISSADREVILNTIPNRLIFLDRMNLDMSPY